MAFFKRIPQDRDTASSPAGPAPAVPAVERRSQERHPVSPDFSLKATLCYVGRDETGAPMSDSRHGWHWKGRLMDCSDAGVRIQLGPGLRAMVGESCDLRLSIHDFEVNVPCHVTNISETADGAVFGLQHAIMDEATLVNYRRIVAVMALASTLRLLSRADQPDESGYFVETYGSDHSARLTLWRHPSDASVSAFELQLSDCLLRAAEGHGIEYFSADDGGSQPATALRCHEIHRLFQWVVPNLPASVPADVKEFLRRFAN